MKSTPQKNKATALAAFAAATACAFLAPSASASLVAYEDFQYDTSGGSGLGGKGSAGGGWQGSWNGSGTLVADTMSYVSEGGISINGGNQSLSITGTSQAYFTRQFASIGNTQEVYFSFLFKQEAGAPADYLNFWIGESASRAHSAGIGDVDSQQRFGVRIFDDATGTNNSQASSTSYTTGTTYLLVGRISTEGADGTGAFDKIEMWVNPDSVSLGTPIVSSEISTESFSLSYFGLQTSAVSNNGTSTFDDYRIDEFRVGTSAAGVLAIPEPSTYAAIFGGLALVAGLVRRKRRAGKA